MLAGLGLSAIPVALLRPLENRYPLPTPQVVARHAGMIVPVGLMRQHSKLELVFSVGKRRLRATRTSEAELASDLDEGRGHD